MKKIVLLLGAALLLQGCAGYHIGSVKPQVLAGIHSIAVPTFTNQTFQPRIEVLMTNTVIKQLQQDGTFEITSEDKADAVLKASIRGLARTPTRSVRGNVLATTEFALSVTAIYTLTARDGRVLLGPAPVIGTTSFFVGNDVASDQRQALPLAVESLAVKLASQISEGW